MSKRRWGGLLCAAALAAVGAASAHEMGSAKVEIDLAKSGTFVILARLDRTHVPPGPLKDSAEALRAAFVEGASIAFDGRTVELRESKGPSATAPAPDSPFTEIRFEGRIPAESKTVTFRQSAAIGWFLVQVVNEGIDGSVNQWIDSKQESTAFEIAAPPPPPALKTTVAQYVALGFQHIVPRGLDHILFVLGLYLFSTRWKPLLAQVTAFTLAHSITLGLAMYDVVSLPSRIVEPAIALSIVYVAVENVAAKQLHKSRIAVVFCFGLLHGLGFAGVLRELGLPRSQFVPALASFNVGVECGQLTVISLAFLAVGAWCGRRAWYRSRVVVPCSLAIAATGLYWTVMRIF